MAVNPHRLPSRLPAGTKYVIEGGGGEGKFQVHSRYLEFPDGTLLQLPTRPGAAKSPGVRSRPAPAESAPVLRLGHRPSTAASHYTRPLAQSGD